MRSINKLREAATYNPAFSDNATRIVCNYLTEIEAEIAANYLELPRDADGVPVKPGEQMTDGQKRVDGMGIAKWDVVSVNECAFYDMSGGCHVSNMCRHVKPRTLEDVLVDMLEVAVGYSDAHTDVSLVAVEKYADEIRELLGDDAR